jgi:hypothetical protein
MKNFFVYHSTEESAFEVNKYGAYTKEEALEVINDFLKEYMSDEDIPQTMTDFEKEMNEGTYTIFEDKDKGYTMLIGVAPKGKLRNVTKEITCLRNEMLEMF